MADNTPIEWADATLNYINGCSVVSPGCKHCYAMKQAHRVPFRAGLVEKTAGGQVWTGEIYAHESALMQALKWKRPRRIFWNAHGDLFHENVSDEAIDRQFAVMALTPQHTHIVLTKRSARMRAYLARPAIEVRVGLEALGIAMIDRASNRSSKLGAGVMIKGSDINPGALTNWPLPNVWLGVSVEDQARADERVPDLLATPAAVRFLSCEPLLGPVDLTAVHWNVVGYRMEGALPDPAGHDDFRFWHHETQGIRWVIAGGESGPGARPMHPDWARSLRDQCAAAGVPFFFKQWGEWAPPAADDGWVKIEHAPGRLYVGHGVWDEWWPEEDQDDSHDPEVYRVGKKRAGRLLDGVEHSAFPSHRGAGQAL